MLIAFFAGGKISPEGGDAFFKSVVKAYPVRKAEAKKKAGI